MTAQAKSALALFGSTSPSYLILESLDACNGLLAEDYPRQLAAFLPRAAALQARLKAMGWQLTGDEPLKLTLCPKARGYTGEAVAANLQAAGIFSEFADPDYLVLMLTPALGEAGAGAAGAGPGGAAAPGAPLRGRRRPAPSAPPG